MKRLYHSELLEKRPRVVVVVGPTASGKSALAIALAKKFDGEVISADSRQVYRGLDIATGKITKREMRGVPHHLIGVVSPKKQFSVDDFVRLGRKTLRYIVRNGGMPIVCGGTAMYIDALLGTWSFPPVPPNVTLRKRLEKKTARELFLMLMRLDPARAKTIERENPRRLIRAIEIVNALGSVPIPEGPTSTIYRTILVGIQPSEILLRRRIRERTALRMRRGMIAEGRRLYRKLGAKRLRELGLEYRLLADYLELRISKLELHHRIESADWHYAKRQMRWWKRNKNIRWFKSGTDKRILPFVRAQLRRDKS